jgi:hypothetical protein
MAAFQSLLNKPSDAVSEMIEGLVMMHPSIKRLDGYNVIVKASIDKTKARRSPWRGASGGGASPLRDSARCVAHG